jgi:hypothetical protein
LYAYKAMRGLEAYEESEMPILGDEKPCGDPRFKAATGASIEQAAIEILTAGRDQFLAHHLVPAHYNG